MSTPMLNISQLTMRFGGINALSDVSFSVQEGRTTSVIGPNGAGKTTLFNCITGMYRPTSGQVQFQGQLAASQIMAKIEKPDRESATMKVPITLVVRDSVAKI